MIRNRLLLCCACLPAKLQPAWRAGRKTCSRDARETSAVLGMHTQSKDLTLGKGLLHIASFLLTVLPANPPQKRFLHSLSRLCSAGADTRAVAHPELSSTSKASWGLHEKILHTPESHEKHALEPECRQNRNPAMPVSPTQQGMRTST